MKRLYSANTLADEGTLHLLKAMLEEASVVCMIRNEALSIAKGDIPAIECIPELWILEDKDYPKAQAIVEEWEAANRTPQTSWVCTRCGEASEGQFTSCWKCGNERA